jgi:hypothetical protein
LARAGVHEAAGVGSVRIAYRRESVCLAVEPGRSFAENRAPDGEQEKVVLGSGLCMSEQEAAG